MWSGLGGGGREIFFLGRGQHLLAKIRKPRLPRSHEILMFVFKKMPNRLKLCCNANLHTPIVLRENQNSKYNSGIAAGGGGQGAFRGSLDHAPLGLQTFYLNIGLSQ